MKEQLTRRDVLRIAAYTAGGFGSLACRPAVEALKWLIRMRILEPSEVVRPDISHGEADHHLDSGEASLADDPQGNPDSQLLEDPVGSAEDGTSEHPALRHRMKTVVLETRPPEELRGYADPAIVTGDGRRRWKQQEWLPLLSSDLPAFDGSHERFQYLRIIDYFNVTDPENLRYVPRGGITFCNIFVWDVTRAMHVEIPRWIEGKKTWTNSIYDWLQDRSQGAFLGWRQVRAYQAQEHANQGFPVVATTVPTAGRLGHIAMIIPGEGEIVKGRLFPIAAQAGTENFVGKSVYESLPFRNRTVEYFVNDSTGYEFLAPGELSGSFSVSPGK